ncbi:hypothetical protein LTR66_007623 [Elasticomyces elasticus]|nr:hypothetical protein LTR66_007623 [Elasticomyces elasticus]
MRWPHRSLEKRANATTPSPFSFSPSQSWDGNDGSWSTFIVRVGSPPQDFRVLPSTEGQETWIPVPEGCTATGDPSNCGSLRGVMPFNGVAGSGFLVNKSSTWISNGIFTLDLEYNLGYQGSGLYGFDTVGLQIENSGGLSQTHQVVAGVASKDFYLGIFGLGPKPANFSTYSDPQPSFMKQLRDNNQIPSLSYGYTAGAVYRNDKVLASLTLGGYDASRFQPSSVTYAFGADDSRSLTVGVQNILGLNTLNNAVRLLPDGGNYFLIDSTVPEIWLPKSACDAFASAFGLTYDNKTDRYLVNDTVHDRLLSLNPTITFSLGTSSTPNSGPTQNIVLPYAAFDLQASYPIYQNATKYFPIRRAANDTQYTIGRTFLQEAYIIADYERQNFTVAQAVFSRPMPASDIRAIHPPSANSSTNGTNSASSIPVHQGLNPGAIAGIAVGTVAAVLLIAGIVFLLVFRKRKQHREREKRVSAAAAPPSDSTFSEDKKHGTLYTSNEVSGDTARHEMPNHFVHRPSEVDGDTSKWSGAGTQEMDGNGISRAEMEGSGYSGMYKGQHGDDRAKVHEIGDGIAYHELPGSEPAAGEKR